MVENENFKNSSHFLLLKTMLEEHNHLKENIYKWQKIGMWCLPGAPLRQSLCSRSVQPWLLGSSTHLINVGLLKLQIKRNSTLIELEVAELAEEPFHHTIDVLLESVHLTSSVVLFQVFHNLLHVVLEVGHVVILLGKTSLNQPEVYR